MSWFEKNEVVAGLPIGMEPIIGQGFEEGKVYAQIDLGSRFVVEGIAKHFLHNAEDAGFFTTKALKQIVRANNKLPGTYVGFAGADENGDSVAYIYEHIS
jgi:hypothetical protein